MKACVNCHKKLEDDMVFCPDCGVKYLVFNTNELINEACPVSVVGQFLLSDDEQIMVKILLKNQCDKVLKAVNIRLKCFDQMGDELEDTVIKIMDQSVENGEVFGDDAINPAADQDTRSFKIIIEKVLLEETGLISTPFSEFTQTNSDT